MSSDNEWPGPVGRRTDQLASDYLKNSRVWPARESKYYLGHVPRLKIPEGPNVTKITKTKIHQELHYTGLKTAGRIYGDYARYKAKFHYEG
jgi:hypothetical protein